MMEKQQRKSSRKSHSTRGKDGSNVPKKGLAKEENRRKVPKSDVKQKEVGDPKSPKKKDNGNLREPRDQKEVLEKKDNGNQGELQDKKEIHDQRDNGNLREFQDQREIKATKDHVMEHFDPLHFKEYYDGNEATFTSKSLNKTPIECPFVLIPELETSKTGTDSDVDEEFRTWSSISSVSRPSDPAWKAKVHNFVASTKGGTTNVEDQDFNVNLRHCAEAIEADIQPLRIPSGSSGSYFMRNSTKEIIAVFKPKNEEPFAPLNPKWPKFFQRILCFCCFGRACLIPNNGYLSETGASLVDQELRLHIVPKTRVVKLASPAFYYRNACACHSKKALKLKAGSYQMFVHGFVSASTIVPEWSKEGQSCPLSLREVQRFTMLFQKMCVLDYVIRNTDRHMDNWLIKYEKDCMLELAAIDNGLAFPVKHPETTSRLRPFPFGWAHLSWAKLPWDDKLREHLLEMLTPQFVQTLCDDIKTLFKYDKEVNRFLKYSQLRVLRGQMWNLRMALMAEEPPSELVKRPLLLVSRKYHHKAPPNDWNQAFSVRLADYRSRGCC